MRNIELKARLRDRAHADSVCASLGAAFQGDLHQTDTYFRVAKGRLKLRENEPGGAELIFYLRPDSTDTRASDYQVTPVDATLKVSLAGALGVLRIVRKTRSLWLWENVRIHLDAVDGLGDFLEFEAVLGEGHDDASGHRQLAGLREAFAISDADLVSQSYSDLLS